MNAPPGGDTLDELKRQVAALREENAALRVELADLTMMYETTMAHGAIIEDELADKNIALEKVQSRISAELREATSYIRSALPAPQQELPSTEWVFLPSSELGGDSFGYHWIDPDTFVVYLLDVCGHGISAALLSLTVLNTLRLEMLPSTDFREPGQVLGGLNKAFQMEAHHGMFFTVWYGVYHLPSRRLVYASGGHPPATLIYRDGGELRTELLGNHQLVIGAMSELAYHSRECVVPEHARLIVVSDGAYELACRDGRLFEHHDFVALACRRHDEDGICLDRLVEDLREAQGNPDFNDDLCILSVAF